MTLYVPPQEATIVVLLEAGYQSRQRGLDVADRPNRDRMAAADMGWVGIDLDDRGLVRIELAPCETASRLARAVTVEDRVVTGGPADHPGHPDVVWIVVFNEVLAA